MNNPFRYRHIIKALTLYSRQNLPLDLFLSKYYRENTAIGSKDRIFISDTIFDILRWQALVEASLTAPLTLEKKIDLFLSKSIQELQENPLLSPSEKLSFPQWLFEKLLKQYGEVKAQEIATISNQKAPRSVRVNLLKTTREALFNELKQEHEVTLSKTAPEGIIFENRTNYINIPSYKNGLFEIQDEGSQLLASIVPVKPQDHFLDYCSGSGGKTLAIAPKMGGKGQIYLHDIRSFALEEARKRLKRAGIQNGQFIPAKDLRLQKLKGKMDAILVDAPCSGTGTFRRNPDMKWKFTEDKLNNLIREQREIFKEALQYLKPTGVIVYGTCSFLKEENEEQRDYFIKTHDLEVCQEFKVLPTSNGPDGFFGVALQKRK